MIKTKAILPLAVGLGVGLVAVKMGVDVVKKAQASGGGDSAMVVVVKQDIQLGTALTAEMLKLAEVPKALIPAGSFREMEKAVGRVISRSLIPGMCVSEALLAPPGTPPGLTMKIPDGMRAVAVEVDEFSSVAGFITPEARVDVVALLKSSSRGCKDTISRTILQDVEVAAVGQEMTDASSTGANVTRSVTLIVTPKDAALLHLAATKGKIRLALRNTYDSKKGKAGFASENALVSGEEMDANRSQPSGMGNWFAQVSSGFVQGLASRPAAYAAIAPEPPKPWTVTVMCGNRTETYDFAGPDSTQRVSSLGFEPKPHKVNAAPDSGRYSSGSQGLLGLNDEPPLPSDSPTDTDFDMPIE